MKNTKKRLVIIGCGMAGGRLVEELVLSGKNTYDITIIGDEVEGNYNRIKLIYKLQADDVSEFELQNPEWFKSNGINAVLGRKVIDINSEERSVALDDGAKIKYDLLVLATGALPFIPPMEGRDLPNVMALRKLSDVRKAREFLQDKSKVMVIGGGLLGLELAIGLKNMGKVVTVSHLLESLMEIQLSPEAGIYLQKKLESKGIRFVMNNYVTQLAGDADGVKKAVFARNMLEIKTDAVFISTGIKPNIALAHNAHIRVNKGIIVDDQFKTENADIFAIGECIEHRGRTYGLVAPVWEQARILARILTGEEVYYEGSELPPTKLKSSIPVYAMGKFLPDTGDQIVKYEDPRSLIYKQLILSGNKLKGANIIGDDLNIDGITLYYSANLPLPDNCAELLFPGAKPDTTLHDASTWPEGASICDCNGVSAGRIRHAIKDGSDTLSKVMASTRAGTGCGNCKNKIKALLVSELGELKDDPADRYFAPGIPMDREDLTEYILENGCKSVSAVLAGLKDTAKDDVKTRMALDFLLAYIWKENYEVEYDSCHVNDRYFGNVQKDGRFSVIPRIPGGVAEPRFLSNLAAVAKEYNAVIKVTGADRIGLYAIEKKDLPAVWSRLEMDSGHAYTKSFRAAKSCVGSEFCRFGLGASMELGRMMDDRYHGTKGPAKFKMGASGCPRNCAEATIKDFGAVAVEGGWDVYIGGNAGAKVIPGVNIVRVKTKEDVIRIADRFYEYYRANGRFHERTAYFLERVGLEAVVDAILYDTEANLKKLDADFQQAVDNYKDPWVARRIDINDAVIESDDTAKSGTPAYVCDVDSLKAGSSHIYKVGDAEVAVFHTRDGKWIVTEPKCPHEEGPIVDAIYAVGRLHCPIHNYSFDAGTGMSNSDEIGALKVYKSLVKDHKLYCDML